MKKILLAIIGAVVISACASYSTATQCDFNGYSFCLRLGSDLKVTESRDVGDFFVHHFRNEARGYNLIIFEGNYPNLADDTEVVNTYHRTLGEVTYRVEELSAPTMPYSVLLVRDDVRLPEEIHITTNYLGKEKVAIDDVLDRLYGCKEIPAVDERCSAE